MTKPAAHVGMLEQECTVVGLNAPSLPELLRFAAAWFEERGAGRSSPLSLAYYEDDQGYWLIVSLPWGL